MSEQNNIPPSPTVQMALLEYRMTALEKRQESDVISLREMFRDDINELRRDFKDEASNTRNSIEATKTAIAKGEVQRNVTLGAALIAVIGISVEILLHFIPAVAAGPK